MSEGIEKKKVKYRRTKRPNVVKINGYTLFKLIGQGGFGKIYVGYYEDNIDEPLAIKQVIISKKAYNYQKLINDINDEIDILMNIAPKSKCNSQISCIHDYFTIEHELRTEYYIVMDYIVGSDLYDFIENNKNISDKLLWSILFKIISGIEYVHRKGVAHNDIKPENIMITKDGNIVYIDFGLSCVGVCFTNVNCTNLCGKKMGGTLSYVAPEIIEQYNQSKKYIATDSQFELVKHQRADMWSLGLVLYQLMKGIENFPYKDDYEGNLENYELVDTILNAPLSRFESDNTTINYIINNLLIREPEKRLTAIEVKRIIEEYIIEHNII